MKIPTKLDDALEGIKRVNEIPAIIFMWTLIIGAIVLCIVF
jgi:hypothetical protein